MNPASVQGSFSQSEKTYSLRTAEKAMFIEQMLHPESTEYNLNYSILIKGASTERIQLALEKIMRNHEAFRSSYKNGETEPIRVPENRIPSIEIKQAESEEASRRSIAENNLPFDLSDIPVRVCIYELPDGDRMLHLCTHHIVADALGHGILRKELMELLSGREIEKPVCDLSCICEQSNSDAESHFEYYKKVFEDGVPVNDMPVKGSRPKVHPLSDTILRYNISAAESRELSLRAKERGTTLFEAFFAAVSLAVGKYCVSEDVVLGVTRNSRDEKTKDTIGMFAATLPVRVKPFRTKSLDEYIKECSAAIRGLKENSLCSFERLVTELCTDRDPSRHPFFDVALNYYHEEEECAENGIVIRHELEPQKMKRDIGLGFIVSSEGIRLSVQYSSELFEREVVENFVGQFFSILSKMQGDRCISLSAAMELPEEQQKTIAGFHAMDDDHGIELLHRRFEQQAALTPEHTAVIGVGGQYTFRQLDENANRVANALIEKGFQSGDSAVVMLRRTIKFFPAILGVLKAGGTYIPTDPDYPAERIRSVLEDSDSKFVIADKISEDIPSCVTIEELLSCNTVSCPAAEVSPEDLAYMIYTSGSTGKPKGVMITHRNICNFLRVHEKNLFAYNVSEYVERFLSVTTVAFDMSMKELYCPLLSGKTLIFAGEDAVRDPRVLVKLFRETEADGFNATPSRVEQYLYVDGFADVLSGLHLIGCGGEKYPESLLKKLKSITDAVILNTYGPTETTVSSNVAVLEDAVTVGAPGLNVIEYVVDKFGDELPIGVIGELYIGGRGVAKGYKNLEKMTAERFIEYKGERVYRSGDYARWSSDGKITIFGRTDHQVKLRGLRIELGEIEGLIAVQKHIRKVVAVIKPISGHDSLCAYFTADEKIDTEELRDTLKKSLTHYMVPDVLMQLDEMPTTPNGKTDLKALPEPKLLPESPCVQAERDTEITRRIKSLLRDILGEQEFSADRELYKYGLNSLAVIRFAVELENAFGVRFELTELMENATIGTVENRIIERLIKGAGKVSAKSEKTDIPGLEEYGLAKNQEGIYVETLANPGTCIYNNPVLIQLGDETDLARLKKAVVTAINAHPYLRTRLYTNADNKICQYCDDEPLDEADIEMITADSIASVKDTLIRPFDLEKDRLFRAKIIRADHDYFFFEAHHIIFDGESKAILLEDISEAYAGKTPETEAYDGYDVYALEHGKRHSRQYQTAKEYYTELFSGCDADCLPLPDVSCELPEKSGSIEKTGEQANHRELADFCGRHHLNANAFFTAAFGYLISRYVGRDEAVFTTIYNGRSDARFEKTVAMMVKTYPVICRPNGKTVKEYVSRIGQQLTENMLQDIYSFPEISKELEIPADILFAYQNISKGKERFCGAERIDIPLELGTAKAAIEFQVFPDGEHVHYICNYRSDLYSKEFMESFISAYDTVLAGFIRTENVEDVSLLSSSDRTLLDSFNATENEYDRSMTVVDLFRKEARENADGIAVVYQDKKYTYQETDALTDRIAACLLSQGIGRGDVVSVLIGRSEYMPIASLGVLKTGAAYQPLDPSYPQERLSFMIEDSAAKLLIADEELTEKLPAWEGKTLYTKDIPSLPEVSEEESKALSKAAPKPDDLFILLYTSGSTGVPKGCMLEHGNIAAFCRQHSKRLEIGRTSVVAAYASYGFDANLMDTYPTLISGAELVIVHEDIRLNLSALNEYYKAQRVTHAFMTTQVARQFLLSADSPYLKFIYLGGEALGNVVPNNRIRLINLYGPTESTVYVTAFEIDRAYRRAPIGKAVENMKLYVVDAKGRRLPVGVPGELCVAGAQVSAGYLNRPEKTAEVFRANPFDSAEEYETMYCTGDIVRLLPNGTVDFIGRSDAQVKVRGFRIELTEVEEIIRRFDGITDVTVVAFDAPAGGKELAAYIVSGSTVDTEALKAFIRSQKPPYMVPAVIMQIDSIPLNQNQKVNRKALPKPELSAAPEQEKKSGALTECEKLLLDILKDTVGITTTDVTSELIGLGLTSISAIAFVTAAEKKFGVDYPVAKLLQGASVMDIENEIMRSFLSGNTSRQEATGKQAAEAEIRDEYPLTQTQLGVYYETMQHPESVLYNVPFCLKFEGIDSGRLYDALRCALKAHPYLNTHITTGKNGFMQVRNDSAEPEISVSELGERDIREVFRTFIRPFILHQRPLYRLAVVTAPGQVWLLMDFHHIVFDGFSVNLFMNSVKSAYETGAAEAEEYSYFDYSLDEEKFCRSDEYAGAEGYFRELLSDFENSTEIPADISGKAEDGKGASVSEFIDRDAVESFCKAHRITPSTLFLSSAFYTVSRFASSKDVYLSTISNGRANSKTRGAVGMFVRTLPVAIRPKDGMSVADYISAAGESMNGSIAHELYPFTEIAGKYGYTTDIMYECQLGVVSSLTVGGHTAESIPEEEGTLKFKLKIVISDSADGICLSIGYNNALYSEKYMQLLARSMKICTERMMAEPSAEVKHLSLLTEEDEEKLERFSRTEHGVVPAGGLVHRMFEERAAAHPDRTAVIACDGQLTYRELNRQANIIANNLIARGVHRGDMIVLLLPRRSYYFAAVLGVLKTGAAFIPCDPQYPAERISLITEDSGAQYIVTTEDKLGQYESEKAIDIADLLKGYRSEEVRIEISPEDLVYAIYTSGSTGKPKGVLLRHIGVCNYFSDAKANILYSKASELNVENVLCITTVSFDMSMKDGLGILCNGKTLIFADEEQMNDPMAIASLMEKYDVEMFSSTPSRIIQYLDYAPFAEQIRKQKIVICGAEMYPMSLLKTLQKTTKAELFNSYGPTEITISANMAHLTNADHVSVGKPLYNYTEFIVDTDDNLLPPGVTGELYVGGPGVAKGYKNLDELTKKQFVEYRGLRVYKTGDYARWDEDGNVIILGRKDNQVKLRGLRIELGEIETLITQQPSVKQALVLIKKLNGQDTLCAYYTASEKLDATKLRDALKQKLTHYMVPTAYLQLDVFPVNANGKTDRKALPEPVPLRTGDYIEAADKVEQFFCDLFAKTLKVDRVGAEDDFFEYGGSSLTVTSIVVEAVEAGYQLSYSDVFSHTTPRALAAFVAGSASGDRDSEIEDFDYSAINGVLSRNTLCSFRNGEQRELGNILLTGATGYMGTHVLYQFLRQETGKAYCLLRKGKYPSVQERLKNMMFYYFGKEGIEDFDERVEAFNGDVTDYESFRQFEQFDISTVFNCAANVKHFSAGTDIEDINIGGTDNCIAFCREKNARLIHFSTVSTAGEFRVRTDADVPPVYTERTLYVGQVLDNKYSHSKFISERNVLAAVAEGLDAKIIRVGTLAPRNRDGEFQINYLTNNFMGRLRTYALVGAFPYSMAQNVIRMGAIDLSATAFLKLAKTPRECCLFNACNNHSIYLSDIIACMRERGKNIRFVEKDEFNAEMMKAAEDPAKAAIISSLLAYAHAVPDDTLKPVGTRCDYTNDILYRMDFMWDITDRQYVERFLSTLEGLRFFDASNLIR
ncbi:MAG: amino acid adenylation domain-containing protein [Eubacteriales bacterium]|nr:amino acid adenylation domain-containing protein [Eubacteriales bacterium]